MLLLSALAISLVYRSGFPCRHIHLRFCITTDHYHIRMWHLVSKVAELKIFTLLLGIWGCNRQSKYWLTQVAEQSCWTSRKFYKVLAWHILFWFILTGRSMQRIYHNVTWSRPLDIILVQAQRQSRNVTADWQRKSTHQGSAEQQTSRLSKEQASPSIVPAFKQSI